MVWKRQPLPFDCVYRAADDCSVPLVTLEIIPSNCRQEEGVKGNKNSARYWNAGERRNLYETGLPTDIVVCNIAANWCRKGNHGTQSKKEVEV